jgi:hypothetical protein
MTTRRQFLHSGAAQGAATAGEAAVAVHAAAASYLRHPDSDEQAARAIVAQVGWSLVRARWFVSVNRDRLSQIAARLAAERAADT